MQSQFSFYEWKLYTEEHKLFDMNTRLSSQS